MATTQEQQTMVQKLKQTFGSRPPASIRALQAKMSVRAPAPPGIWISQDVFTISGESNLSDVLYKVVKDLAPPRAEIPTRDSIKLAEVPFEWIAQKAGDTSSNRDAGLSQERIYERLNKEANPGLTILYAHGGAFYAGSPSFSRAATTKLAKLTKGRVASIAYRLAPQNPFPAALLDLLTAWLSLLFPAENSRHSAVSPETVVLAGDSSGGNLCLGLIQVLLRLRHTVRDEPIHFNGEKIHEVPLPAGVAVLSPYLDLARILPCDSRNKHIDYLRDIVPVLQPNHIADDLWPSKPPRGDPYCHPSAWLHPLVCPNIAPDWTGSPPMFFAVGEERLADCSKMIATRAVRQGVTVLFAEYEGMPHVFPMVLNKLPQSNHCFQEWAKACVGFSKQTMKESRSTITRMPGREHQATDVRELLVIDLDDVKLKMAKRAEQQRPWVPEVNSDAKL